MLESEVEAHASENSLHGFNGCLGKDAGVSF